MTRLLVVAAAGAGSRLKAAGPKALVRVGGRAMIDHLLELCSIHIDHAVIVAHPSSSDQMRAHLDGWRRRVECTVVEQPAPTGMLDAVLLAAPVVDRAGPERIWIIWCDQVGVLPQTLARLAAADAAPAPAGLIFPTVRQEPPYIHFARDGAGRITAVLQRREHDDMPAIGESDMGLFSLSREAYLERLTAFAREVARGSGTGERNFLPFVPWLAAREAVDTIPASDAREAMGINTPDELRRVEAWLLARSGRP
jgi:bifunctional UDP-N-acetylglucosamine pyrophosphorylase / glucosamine-1-phosphate N-acetyltransferase